MLLPCPRAILGGSVCASHKANVLVPHLLSRQHSLSCPSSTKLVRVVAAPRLTTCAALSLPCWSDRTHFIPESRRNSVSSTSGLHPCLTEIQRNRSARQLYTPEIAKVSGPERYYFHDPIASRRHVVRPGSLRTEESCRIQPEALNEYPNGFKGQRPNNNHRGPASPILSQLVLLRCSVDD